MVTNDHPPPIKIILGATASAALTATGESCFAVIGRGDHNDPPGRWMLYLIPTDIPRADAAVRVARGTATARKIKTPTA